MPKKQKPIDPLSGPRFALEGRVVTMNASFTVLDRGVVHIDAGQIIAVRDAQAPPPPGYENAPLLKTKGTIYPGLIELHNHLSYNALPLWNVPRKFTNRDQWGRIPDYRKLVSGPMNVLGKTEGYVEAVVRFVEAKCLLAGVTTSQGIMLYSNQGIPRYYRGIVRNVEQTDEADLPEAGARIPDVEAADADKFLARQKRVSCLLLHLSEGTDQIARQHFRDLRLAGGEWAITPSLAGIHCVALTARDFETTRRHGGSMIWSPLSNLLLYGRTANVKAAEENGLVMGLGSDWSTTGSKNLLGELKVARLVSDSLGGLFRDRELLALATTNAAQILKWDKALGSIEPGKRADLLVLEGDGEDPYAQVFKASETDIVMVIINGAPRLGSPDLMSPFGKGTERWKVGGQNRVLNLAQATADPVVGALKLADAQDKLEDGLGRLPELAKALERKPAPMMFGPPDSQETRWFLMLDHDEPAGSAIRPHLGTWGKRAQRLASRAPMATVPLSKLLEPIDLDPLTAADDERYLDLLRGQGNLPRDIKEGLPSLY